MIDPRNPDYRDTPASDRRPSFDYTPAAPAARPMVTILTPYWNHAGATFHETALCVLRQSFQQWEWLIINDAATDPACLRILDLYRDRDPRIRVIDNAVNLGLSATRNAGFEAAAAEYVFLLDDDDLIEPTTLEMLFWCLESYPEFAVANGWSIGFGAQEYLWAQGFEQGVQLLESNSATGRAMVRRSAHRAAGGYDASIRDGFEDWDFWLRLADHGMWGITIPEYLDWYRRREHHGDRWANLDGGERTRAFQRRLREKYPRLYAGEFPAVDPRPDRAPPRRDPPAVNRLARTRRRALFITSWPAPDGPPAWQAELAGQLRRQGWDITVACTRLGDSSGTRALAGCTPDVFPLHSFLRPADHPAFLRYLIESRGYEIVVTADSDLGYHVLPYLRTFCPESAYVDVCHAPDESSAIRHCSRYSPGYQEYLDLSITTCAAVRDWMTQNGADPARILVCAATERMSGAFEEAIALHRNVPRPGASPPFAWALATQAVEMLRLSIAAEEAGANDDPAAGSPQAGTAAPAGLPGMRFSHTRELRAQREAVIRDQRGQIARLQETQAWLEQERRNWEAAAHESQDLWQACQDWIQRLEGAKAWLEQQVESWRSAAQRSEDVVLELRRLLDQHKQTQAWLEQQVESWRSAAQRHAQTVSEQQAVIEEQERAKAWLEQQVESWCSAAQKSEEVVREQLALIEAQEKAKAWLEQQVENWRLATERSEAVVREQRALIEAQSSAPDLAGTARHRDD